jgi:ubiquitin carboxyl-terminal hydrolase 7
MATQIMTVDTLEEKVNGGPSIDVEDNVSVRDRASHTTFDAAAKSLNSFPYLSLDEAFVAKHMPDTGHEVKDFKVFTWRLANWRKLEKKLTSPEFECGGHRW